MIIGLFLDSRIGLLGHGSAVHLAIGLCNSIWPSISHDSRMSTLIMVSRFLLYLHLYYNPHLYTPMTMLSRYMRSISSSRKTCIHLSSSHHVITYTVIGYISSCSLTYTPSISLTTPYYHTHSSIFVSGNSPLLASL